MTDRILHAIARLCLRRSKLIAIVSAVIAALSLVAASRVSFDPDLLNLLPQDNRQVRDFRKVLRDLGTLDNHVVVLHLPKGADIGTYEPLVESIVDGYRKSPRIEDVNYRIPNPLDFVDVILPHALLFLSPAEIEVVAQKLSDQGIRGSIERNKAILQTPQAFALKQLIQYDPFNLAPIFLGKITAASGGFRIDASTGYFVSEDHTMLLILAKPKRAAQDFQFAKALLAEGSVIEARALNEFRKSLSPDVKLPVIEHTGGYVIAVGDSELIRKDVIINILSSFFGVLALFIYAFRRTAALFYAALPMALGLALTFGVAGLFYGDLSSASAGFAALLAGLGIDFITLTYGRYVDERNRGLTMTHALVLAMRKTVPAVFVAAATTAATFYAFLFTEFQGMAQLGFLTGTGILFFMVATIFLLPALIVITEGREARRAPKLFLHSFGSGGLIDASIRHPRATIAIWVVFTIVMGALGTQVRFSDNVQDLRAKGNEGVINQEKVTQKFGQSFEFMMYVVEGKSLDDVITRTHAATTELRPLVASGTIDSFQSIAAFVPPRDQQLAVIKALESSPEAFDSTRIERTFRASLVENGFRPDAYDRYLPTFKQALSPQAPMSLETLDSPDLLSVTGRFVKKTEEGWMSVIYLYPEGGRWPREVPAALVDLAERHPENILTGINLVSGTLRRIVKEDATRSTVIGTVAVVVLLLIGFRSVKMTLLTFAPFVAGVSGMLGMMALLNLDFNFMNVFVGLMIVGVATDYGVHVLHRYKEDPSAFPLAARETGKAVVMAALTTVVGYGSFALSHYPGLRSIGYASTFGIGLSGLAAITLLPAILVLSRRT